MAPDSASEWLAFAISRTDALLIAFAWPLTIAGLLVLFRRQFGDLLSSFRARIDDPRQGLAVQFPGGGLKLDGQGAPTPESPRAPLNPFSEATHKQTPEADAAEIAALRLQAVRFFFAWLGEFLRPHTQRVLAWLAERGSTTEHELWSRWDRDVPTASERQAVINALLETGLVSAGTAGRLAITPLGSTYLNWRHESAQDHTGSRAPGTGGGTAPFTAYGSGLRPGEAVKAYINGQLTGSTTVDSAGQWLLYIEALGDAPPAVGDAIVFVREDGQIATEVWEPGGVPRNIAQGTRFGSTFLGTIAESGMSLVVFPGGSLEQLHEACLEADVASVMATVNGEWVSYVPSAPTFVNAAFVSLFPNGLPPGTALVVVGHQRG